MSFYTLTKSFGDPTLLATVLGDKTFASKGYVWGFDNHVYYCFCNPQKLHFEIWKKRYGFTWWWIVAALALFLAPATFGLSSLLVLPTALILPKFYVTTAEDQNAPVFTDGPQMRLPLNASNLAVMALLIALAGGPPILGAIVFGVFGGGVPGVLVGAVAGALVGANLVSVALFIIGLMCTPYGSVVTPIGIGEAISPPVAGTYYFNRTGIPVTSYSVAKDNPPGPWGAGGLHPMILNTAPQLMARTHPVQFVVWGIVQWNKATEPGLEGAIDSILEDYGTDRPQGGLILVAGANPWNDSDTIDMTKHKTVWAVACDGHDSAMLGSFTDCASGLETHIHLDPISRYGFKMVP